LSHSYAHGRRAQYRTWTNYRGLDPEVSYLRPSALPRQEFLIPPLPRVLVMRVDIGPRSR